MNSTNYKKPEWASVGKNIKEAQEYASSHNFVDNLIWFYEKVRNNKDSHLPTTESWDYKQISNEYEDFGNFNYGATGAAMGFPDWLLLRMAGWAQEQGGNSPPEFGYPLGDPPYGDDPKDQEHIRKGIEYAKEQPVIPSGSTAKILPLEELYPYPYYPLGIFVKELIRSLPSTLVDLTDLTPSDLAKVLLDEKSTLSDLINEIFRRSRTAFPRVDPMALDLDGDGLETIGIDSQHPILFDHDGDGLVNAQDAFYQEFPDPIPLINEAKGLANLACRY